MRVAKRLGSVDHYGPFLAMLNRNGRVSTSFNAGLESDMNERSSCVQFFRHSLSQDSNISDQGPYPQNMIDRINFPASAYNSVSVDGPVQGDVITNAFRQYKKGSVYWCPINRPDLEDMSWNLNSLKIGGDIVSNPAVTPNPSITTKILSNVPMFENNKHRRLSKLYMNNALNVDYDAMSPNPAVNAGKNVLQNKFDCVLRYGSIDYDFMNKQDVGAVVEVIVYRIKNNAMFSAQAANYNSNVDLYLESGPDAKKAYFPYNNLIDSTAKGYLDTLATGLSTENLQGRKPKPLDVYDNPNYPFLPNTKKIVQGKLGFAEVMRNRFAMTSGSRRSLRIDLPGIKYNPASQLAKDFPTTPVYPIIDKYTYTVVVAVNGQKMTRSFDALPRSNVPIAVMENYFNGSYKYIPGLAPNGVPYLCYPDLDITDGLSLPNGIHTVTVLRIRYDNNAAGVIDYEFIPTPMTVDIEIDDVAIGTPNIPPGYSRYIMSVGNLKQNNYVPVANVQYTISGPHKLQAPIGSPTATPTFWYCSFNMKDQPPVNDQQIRMGDNYAPANVQFSCRYTEHIGACVFRGPDQKELYDCGEPELPSMNSDFGSTERATILIPASTAVRQGQRITHSVDNLGVPIDTNVMEEQSCAAG